MPEIDEEEIIKKVKQGTSELKDVILSGAKVAKEKIFPLLMWQVVAVQKENSIRLDYR